MSFEDFTTYVEVDPNAHISVATNVITFTGLARNESAYVYKDAGVDHFNGDFTHLVDAIYTSVSGTDVLGNWALGNDIGDVFFLQGAGKNALLVFRSEANGINANDYLRENDGGTLYTSFYVDTLSPQNRYYKIVRDEAVGTYGTIYLYIYSDAARTNLLSTLSIALHTSKKDYRYVYAVQSYNDGNAGAGTGRNENLDLQETVNIVGQVLHSKTLKGLTQGRCIS